MFPPRKVFLFSGHMIDALDRATPRFPAEREPDAIAAIGALVARLDAGPSDLAICSGACGGDLIFAEAMLARDVPLEMYLPFEPATFVKESVDFAGGDWHDRFFAASDASTLHVLRREGTTGNPYEEVNRRMLEAAGRFGPERVDFICLWDGQGGDGPGGTRHLVDEVARGHGRTHRLDTTQLWR